MTRRKKWPHSAEWARMDAIAAFAGIRRQLREAQKIMLSSPLEAMLLIGQAADKTIDGESILRQVKEADGEI